jgi:hypothetical protein
MIVLKNLNIRKLKRNGKLDRMKRRGWRIHEQKRVAVHMGRGYGKQEGYGTRSN